MQTFLTHPIQLELFPVQIYEHFRGDGYVDIYLLEAD